jgi:hypothetical protein
MSEHLANWDKLARPPKDALKQIKGGRLSGMTDINPQWRYKIMTEIYGPCGTGWDYCIERLWIEPGAGEEKVAFAQIALRIYGKDETPLGETQRTYVIPGIGGSMFLAQESKGLRTNDEAYKMAITDALSVAMKMLGVGADIYMGRWTGTTYKDSGTFSAPIHPSSGVEEHVTEAMREDLREYQAHILTLIARDDWNGALAELNGLQRDLTNEEFILIWQDLDAPTRRRLKYLKDQQKELPNAGTKSRKPETQSEERVGHETT